MLKPDTERGQTQGYQWAGNSHYLDVAGLYNAWLEHVATLTTGDKVH